MLENRFKTNLIHEIEDMFPGCLIIHLDANDIQGMPTLGGAQHELRLPRNGRGVVLPWYF
jgi:hypothetical protein